MTYEFNRFHLKCIKYLKRFLHFVLTQEIVSSMEIVNSMEVDEISSQKSVDEGSHIPRNMTLTENLSPTYSSTTSSCLDFFFEVLQRTERGHIVESLTKAWNEDPLLALKLIFQLRDVRKGKGAVKEFHYCIIWLFHNHPQTLIQNLEFIAQHGYWKDLSWLVKFILDDDVSISTEGLEKKRQCNQSTQTDDSLSLEDLIKKRVDGNVSKRVWKQYLNKLSDDKARKDARAKFQEISKEIHLTRSNEAKLKKKSSKAAAAQKLSQFKTSHNHFCVLYKKVIDLFTSALIHDKEILVKEKTLHATALAGKWAPAIGGSIDFFTELGKSIARSLYSSVHQLDNDETQLEFDIKAFTYYRKLFLTPLREAISVPERLMSKRKWEEIEYERVPSVCMKRNKKNFLKKDSERFGAFLEDVKSGEKKIASGALMPHEIVAQVMNSDDPKELATVGELQWASYVDKLKRSGLFESALAICDVSGSMSGIPMTVAIALSLLTAALSKPPFNSVICTFSHSPSLQKIDQATLQEKVSFVQSMEWGMNTNLQVNK